MKTALFFLLLTAALFLSGCSHYGMHHYYNDMDNYQTEPNFHFQQNTGSMESDGYYPR